MANTKVVVFTADTVLRIIANCAGANLTKVEDVYQRALSTGVGEIQALTTVLKSFMRKK